MLVIIQLHYCCSLILQVSISVSVVITIIIITTYIILIHLHFTTLTTTGLNSFAGRTRGADYLKIDVEGFEWGVLSNMVSVV